ncbi:hypothetical protein [uncultured Brevibacillus sp.]|nr:hypothetical protein [uncultured Brevibacillus sp.]
MISPNCLLHHAISIAHDDAILEQFVADMDESLEQVAIAKAMK